MNASSRHRQRLRPLRLAKRVSPGGKGLPAAKQSLQQEGDEQLAMKPRTRGLLIRLAKMAQAKDGLEPLEHKLHLPPAAVELQGFGWAECLRVDGREDEDVCGCLQRLGRDLRAVLLGPPARLALSRLGGLTTSL